MKTTGQNSWSVDSGHGYGFPAENRNSLCSGSGIFLHYGKTTETDGKHWEKQREKSNGNKIRASFHHIRNI